MNVNDDEIAAVAQRLSILGSGARRTNSIVRKYGEILQAKIMARASGRPGPNAPTGDYRRSISLVMRDLGQTAVVGTNKPQARRLEYGFHGADSRGRSYNQPPYPHFGPAVDEVRGPFRDAVADAIGRGLR